MEAYTVSARVHHPTIDSCDVMVTIRPPIDDAVDLADIRLQAQGQLRQAYGHSVEARVGPGDSAIMLAGLHLACRNTDRQHNERLTDEGVSIVASAMRRNHLPVSDN